jgi:hypothetical protein
MPTIVALTEKEFRKTILQNMIDVTGTTLPATDIWPYLEELAAQGYIPASAAEMKHVSFVFRDERNTYDHVLIPTTSYENFLIVVVDLATKSIKGHFEWDLIRYFGLES